MGFGRERLVLKKCSGKIGNASRRNINLRANSKPLLPDIQVLAIQTKTEH